MANAEQLALLKAGVEGWNKWREENYDVRVNLKKANLGPRSTKDKIWQAKAHFKRGKVWGANLSRANLSKANLSEANLVEADLEGSNLSETSLSRANLSGALLHRANLIGANLSGANLRGAYLGYADLMKANLSEANLSEAWLARADLRSADLTRANLRGAYLFAANFAHAVLFEADLSKAFLLDADLTEALLDDANLSGANLGGASLGRARLIRANLSGADLSEANLSGADLSEVNLRGARLSEANLSGARLSEANLSGANLSGANLREVNLSGANLSEVDLSYSNLVRANIINAQISKSTVYGVSIWDLEGEFIEQKDLIITPAWQSSITVDNIKVAQFVYLILNNREIREVINTLTSKSVLILGRFAILERKAILDALRDKLREYDLLPIVFDFDRPTDKDFTETIKTLAGLSYFVIADITNPKSSPLELQATVPDYQIPFVPIIQEGEQPFAMMVDLQKKYPWVLDTLSYSSIETLIKALKPAIIDPAIQKHNELRLIKAREPKIRSANDFIDDKGL